MSRLLFIFIITPILEIGVFMQVGDLIGLFPTLLMVFVTAVIGVQLLKAQGLKTWAEIQLQLSQGQIPAMEMASAAQLLFAGGLLLTPGFVTDFIGFSLLVPQVRKLVAAYLMKRWQGKVSTFSYSSESRFSQGNPSDGPESTGFGAANNRRTIEGEFEEK